MESGCGRNYTLDFWQRKVFPRRIYVPTLISFWPFPQSLHDSISDKILSGSFGRKIRSCGVSLLFSLRTLKCNNPDLPPLKTKRESLSTLSVFPYSQGLPMGMYQLIPQAFYAT
jgi:hypothetical protein